MVVWCSGFLLFKRISVTITHEGSAEVTQTGFRMHWLYHSICLILVLIQGNRALENRHNESNLAQIRSPMLEVFMHLPPKFRDVRSFRNTITQQRQNARTKREADVKPAPSLEKPEPEKLVSALPEASHPVLPIPDAIRGPVFHKYPVKEFDVVDIDDPDDPRRRRNDSSDDDNSQRDKRTFLEEGSGETTTPLPFWKRKKENPPFITGRAGPGQNGNYPPAQHRSGESARESHSMKNLDKTVQSNEISRINQDSYYSATNRRTYSRQYDSGISSTPKSVYDTIDYSKRTQDRSEFGRNQDSGRNQEEKKETPREARPTHEQYRNYNYNPPWLYDRPYYQPAYPYPTEVIGRGVEYYHRTYDPTTGRIIYYANMPEQRSYDYRYLDPISRNFYLNRPYGYDPYYRSYVPPFDYRFAGRSVDYYRSGRSSSQAYSHPYPEREKFPRDARFNGVFETGNRLKDDYRNKTYVIYDVDEGRSQFPRPQYIPENNRPNYPPSPSINPSGPQVPFRQVPYPPMDYFPPAAFPPRNQFYPSSGPAWGFNHRTTAGVTNSNSRPLNSPEVQLPLTTSNRGGMDTPKKS